MIHQKFVSEKKVITYFTSTKAVGSIMGPLLYLKIKN